MTTWPDIVKSALVGTERTPALPQADNTGDPGSIALSRLGSVDQTTDLLRAAAIAGAYRRAGKPARHGMSPSFDVAPVDTRPECPTESIRLLRMVFGGEMRALGNEAIELIGVAGKRIPAVILPEFLDSLSIGAASRVRIGRGGRPTSAQEVGDADFFQMPAVVLGELGQWLARQNPRWGVSITGGTVDWDTSPAAERAALLWRMRLSGVDTAIEARRLLEATWTQEAAKDRAQLLEPLRSGITDDDEPFLETALSDRSKEVHSAAASLLARLPRSRHVARMMDRARKCMRVSFAFGRGHVLDVTIPKEVDAAWAPDTTDAGRIEPRLRELASSIPPAFWADQFKSRPAEIVRLFATSEWDDGLLPGLARAVSISPDPAWTVALLAAAETRPSGAGIIEELKPAIAALSRAEFEAYLAPLLGKSPIGAPGPMRTLLPLHHGAMSEGFAVRLVEIIGDALAKFSDYQTLNGVQAVLDRLAYQAPPRVADALEAMTADESTDNAARRKLGETADILRFRGDLRRAIFS